VRSEGWYWALVYKHVDNACSLEREDELDKLREGGLATPCDS
jgi:hypothetical protein